MGLLYCLIYIAAVGILFFALGRFASHLTFDPNRFPFRCYPFETKLYALLKVKSWQSKAPDMSKLLPQLMPKKEINAPSHTDLPLMINETCIAELTHILLCFCGIALPFIWRGIGGILVMAIYILLGNLPFIVIQRYNRPRLQRLNARRKRGEKT